MMNVLKLSFVLILLPFWLTLSHVLFVLQRTHVVVVSPVEVSKLLPQILVTQQHAAATLLPDSFESCYGVYRAVSPQYFQYASSVTTTLPSIFDIGSIGATWNRNKVNNEKVHGILWKENRWCLSGQYCSRPIKIQPGMNNAAPAPPPPIGIWSNDSKTGHVHVRYLNQVTRSSNRNLAFIFTEPTTSLLLCLLFGLAFLYWNNRIDPSVVSKSYVTIVSNREYYRAFTGATAHFDALHLGFNSMALYALGDQLEEHTIGSIPFLFYNVSLVPITTILMMCMTQWKMWRNPGSSTALSEQSAVGYSGVLFAWMVVASLEQDAPNCPIPLFPDVCFHTYSLLGIVKVNFGPIIQLFVAQLLLRRASFIGHLAGIIAGFMLHWRLLPLSGVQPANLIPALYCCLYFWPMRNGGASLKSMSSTASESASNDNPNSPMFLSAGSLIWRGLFLLSGVGFYIGLDLTLLLSLIFQAVLFYYAITHDKGWNGILVSFIVGIITDSMTLGGWTVLFDLFSNNTSTSLYLAILYLSIRIIWQVGGLLYASNMWKKTKSSDTAFVLNAVLGGTILDSAAQLGNSLFHSKAPRSSSANAAVFEGRGIMLGGPSSQLSSIV